MSLDDRGSVVLEVAIITPIILMLVFGYLFFLQAVNTKMLLQTAAREGARVYAAQGSATAAESAAYRELDQQGIDSSDVSVTARKSGSDVWVTVDMPYSLYIPFAGDYDMTLTGKAVFRRGG